MTQTAQEVIRSLLEANPDEAAKSLLTVIAETNVDLDKVWELDVCYLNDAWSDRLNKKIQNDGFKVIRIQTEWHHGAHVTMVYLAKMR